MRGTSRDAQHTGGSEAVPAPVVRDTEPTSTTQWMRKPLGGANHLLGSEPCEAVPPWASMLAGCSVPVRRRDFRNVLA